MERAGDTVRLLSIRRTLDGAADAQRLFSALTGGGKQVGAVLLQSSDNIPRYGERSLAAVGSSLMLTGREDRFTLEALDARGRCLLPLLAPRFESLAQEVRWEAPPDGSPPGLVGRIEADRRSVPGRQRPFRRNAMDLIRSLSGAMTGDADPFIPAHGCFAAFAYAFVHQYENLERHPRDALHEPDFCCFLATRMFVIDHAARRTHLVSSVPILSGPELASMIVEAEADVRRMVEYVQTPPAHERKPWRIGPIGSDTSADEFRTNVRRIQSDIFAGRAFQVVYGRMLTAEFHGSPFDVYAQLSEVNPSPYMFYFRDGEGVLLAASPEMAVRVGPDASGRRVQLRPIAGTKPRGRLDGRIDPLIDAKYETALKIDPKELAEHTMLVDLARNDLASICKAGTTQVDEPFIVEKYSHVQHLVSQVSGLLRDDLDALHAYLATMNMGTVTGAPKLEAMKMIHAFEATSRGYFAGGVGYFFPDGRMDTALVIRAIRFKHGAAHVRVAAGIVADSVPEAEWEETESKAAAALGVLSAAAGFTAEAQVRRLGATGKTKAVDHG